MTSQPSPRHPRLRTRLAAAAALPLLAVPLVMPVAASAADAPPARTGVAATAADGWDPTSPFGSTDQPGTGWLAPYEQGTTTTVDAEPASAEESTGVVMVRTEVDYGTAEAAGTGLVLTADGIVVTNHHVVQGSTSITVTTPSGASYPATVLGYDATHDVAVLQLRGTSGLATVTPDEDPLTAGQPVTAVGNAEGAGSLTAADGTLTRASTAITVQEEDGSSSRLIGLVQVDADVVSGDSGGALLDADGEVIGMNVAASSGSSNISGYAIPIARVLDIAAKVMAGQEGGSIELGYDGALGLQLYDTTAGPVVAGVVDDGAAVGAGITEGSIVTALDGQQVGSVDELTSALAGHDAGEQVSLAWTDTTGASHRATVTLGRAPVA